MFKLGVVYLYVVTVEQFRKSLLVARFAAHYEMIRTFENCRRYYLGVGELLVGRGILLAYIFSSLLVNQWA